MVKLHYLFSFQNLISAYYQCRKRKRLKSQPSKFEFHLEKEIINLEKLLENYTWKPLPFSVFVVTEPKIREIFAAEFRDRVIHHLLYNYLSPIFEPKFIFDSYACRKSKGTHRAIKRLSQFLRKITVNDRKKVFYLQADIQNFFPSINHNILFHLIQEHVRNPDILWLTKTIIYYDCTKNPVKKGQLPLFGLVPPHKSLFNVPPGQGLPIGNLTSQFFANIYLNELDQFIKHSLKCKYYIRYVDDFVILDESKENLYRLKQEIDKFLQLKLFLKLHPKKSIVQDVNKGIDTLGYLIKPTHILVRKRVVKNFKKRLFQFQKGKINLNYALSCINSYYAHFMHADSYRLRKHLWEKHFGILKKYLKPVDDFRYFKLKK
jgi:retron-type reverse transcriptase